VREDWSCRRPSVWRLPSLGGCFGFLVRKFCHTGQRAAGRCVPSWLAPEIGKVSSNPDVGIYSTLGSTVPTLLQSPGVVPGAPVPERLGRAPA
jgi:hypothetical protein